MNDTGESEGQRYVSTLRRELRSLPEGQRRMVIEGVEEHIGDALAEGREIGEVLAGLGSPRDAAAAYARELGGAAGPDPRLRARRVLTGAAVTAAVVTAVGSLAVPLFGPEGAGEIASTIVLLVLPIALAAMPMAFPRRSDAAGIVSAAAMTALMVAAGLCGAAMPGLADASFVLLPAWFAICVAAVVPLAMRLSARTRSALRVVGAVLVGLPALLPMMGALSGAVMVDAALLIWLVVGLGVGLLYAWRRWVVSAAIAVVGAVLMIGALIDPTMLFLAFWVVGGWLLALGAAAAAATPRRRR